MRPSQVQSRITTGPPGPAAITTSWVNSSWTTTSTTDHGGSRPSPVVMAAARLPQLANAARTSSTLVDRAGA